MNDGLIAGLCIIGIITVSVTPYIINKIIKFKLEVAKLQSETEIKKEEIRAKNQIEIEKMIKQENEFQKAENSVHRNSRFYDNNEETTKHRNEKRLSL